jgi:hypothetical protein
VNEILISSAFKADELLGEAREAWQSILNFEAALLRDRDYLLACAWRLGSLLGQMKEVVGHGRWLFWLGGHWPEIGEKNAQRCMAFQRENPNPRNSSDLKRSENLPIDGNVSMTLATYDDLVEPVFTDESIRKFMWGYIPAKQREELEGDQEIRRAAHHLTVVNGFAKFDRQLRLGHITASQPDMRRDFAPIIPRLVELLGREWFVERLRDEV